MSMRKKNSLQKTVKDYIVPIIWLFLILLLIFTIFSSDNDIEKKVDLENRIWLDLNLDSNDNKAYIIYSWWKKSIVDDSSLLYKWEKLIIKEWIISLSWIWIWDAKINKLWELEYKQDWSFFLESSDLWINSKNKLTINMKFASIKVWEHSNISFSQNEVLSSIYLLNWTAEVTNLSWVTSFLAKWEKISVSRIEANQKNIDLSLNKEKLDDYYKNSQWFIANNWASYLQDINKTSSWIITNKNIFYNSNILSFNNILDESNISSNSIIISWIYSNKDIEKITLNNIDAEIDKITKSFKFKKINTLNKENDLIFKVYNKSNDLMSKFVYTIYNNSSILNSSKFNSHLFNIDGSKFVFTSIKDWIIKRLNQKTIYTTYWDFLTLYWFVWIKWVKNVIINWYSLKSFNWSSWRYHPSVLNNNLNLWTNIYEVKYLNDKWDILYINHFTIIKKKSQVNNFKKSIKKISNEININ